MTAAEMANRTAKATRLAQQLLAHGATLEQVEALGDAGWSMVAELAGDNPPSDLTRAAVVGLFREIDTPLWPDPTGVSEPLHPNPTPVHETCTPDPPPAVDDPFAGFGDMGVALDQAKTRARGGR